MSWRRTNGTLLLRILETLSRRSLMTSWRRATETFLRRSTETSLDVSFETYLRRRWDGHKDVTTTSSRRPLAEWDISHEGFVLVNNALRNDNEIKNSV